MILSDKNEVFSECKRCGKPIKYGNGYVTILKNIEQAEIEANRDITQVIYSEDIYTLCGRCGNLFDFETLKKLIESIPLLQPLC